MSVVRPVDLLYHNKTVNRKDNDDFLLYHLSLACCYDTRGFAVLGDGFRKLMVLHGALAISTV